MINSSEVDEFLDIICFDICNSINYFVFRILMRDIIVGYSSHDDSYSSDEKPIPRGRRDKGKRSNLKDESSSESDEEFRPSDASEEKPRNSKRKGRNSAKKVNTDEDDLSDVDKTPSSEDSDVCKIAKTFMKYILLM